jgi:hypothetical protein
MHKPSATDWDRLDALTDDQIDTSEVLELSESFFSTVQLRMPDELQSVLLHDILPESPRAFRLCSVELKDKLTVPENEVDL